jgi:protein involved in polysaccharide export with SLBB domain
MGATLVLGRLTLSKDRKLGRALVLALATALGLGCGVGRASADSPDYQVGPGDVLQVAFYAGGEKQEEFTGTISTAGTITSPLLGEVKVEGMTTYEVAKSMTAMLAKDFFVNPQVLVSVKDYAGQVFVMGAVNKPGAYAYQEGLTAMRACLLAGGFTQYASLRRVKISRVVDGKSKTTIYDLDKVSKGTGDDPVLVKGDRVDVPKRGF